MLELHGIPVSPGVAIGPALVLNREGYRIPNCQVAPEDVDKEIARLRRAVDAVSATLESNRKSTAALAGDSTMTSLPRPPEVAGFFAVLYGLIRAIILFLVVRGQLQ